MAHWSPSPGAQDQGIKLFIFKCQSSRQHSEPLPLMGSESDIDLNVDPAGYTVVG